YTYTNLTSCSKSNPASPFAFIYNRAVSSRTIDAHDGTPAKIWSYNFNGTVTTVTDPDNNDAVHTFTLIHDAVCSPYETKVRHYQGSSNGATPLLTVETQFVDGGFSPFFKDGNQAVSVLPSVITTTLPNGQVKQETYQYDSACTSRVVGGVTFPPA